MTTLPTLFLSHGAPDLPIQTGSVQIFLRSLRHQLPKPSAILVISAHWNATPLMVSTAPQPRTIYDFSGFPPALSKLTYPAPGSPALGDRIITLLSQAGIPCTPHPTRGFDHGTWTPLILAYPNADIPVVQLSVQYRHDSLHHLQVGQALAPLRQEGVLVIGSGSATHNFSAFARDYDAPPPDWVQEFDGWLAKTVETSNWGALRQYRTLAPHAHQNHPTEEHLFPLFTALGAAGENAHGRVLHRSYTYGGFSMAAYAFD